MQILVLAFPEQGINIAVMSDMDLADESNRQVAREQVWQADFCPTIATLRDKYSVDDILVCGPFEYARGLAQQLQDYFPHDLALNVMIIPTGDKIEVPDGVRQETESGLII